MKLVLDPRRIDSLDAVHDLVAAADGVPEWYGRNLDALWDLLTGELEAWHVEVLDPGTLRERLGEDARRVVGLVLEAVEVCPGGSITLRGAASEEPPAG